MGRDVIGDRIGKVARSCHPTFHLHGMGLVETYRRTLETTELETRIAALEAKK